MNIPWPAGASAVTRLAAVALGAVVMLAASSASATIVIATFTGTVASGKDVSGWFLEKGADLTGQTYVAQFTLDTTLGTRQDALPFFDRIVGSGFPPAMSATITINGAQEPAVGFSGIIAIVSPQFGEMAYDDEIHGNFPTPFDGSLNVGALLSGLQTLTTPIPLTHTDLLGAYSVHVQIPGNPDFVNAYADLAGPGTVEVQVLGVPEPSAWAMMLIGFGAVGAATRLARRRDRGAVAAA